MSLVQVTAVSVSGPWKLDLTFTDGWSGTVDLSFLDGRGIFAPLSDPEYFDLVRVDAELGTITWPNGADVAPETLRRLADADLG